MNELNAEVDVAIVGLGPTGLVLAHTLGQRGLRVLVLEREPQFYGNARAVFTDGECMRIFQSIGMADRLHADMIEDVPVQMLLPDGACLVSLQNTERLHGWSMSNFFYQPLLETALADGLAIYPNVRVLRGREVTRFTQDDAGVDLFHIATPGASYAKAQSPLGEIPRAQAGEERVRAKYLVGADGGRSVVRNQLGIAMTGKNFPNPWLVVDIKAKDEAKGLRHVPYFAFICDPKCPTVNCVQPQGYHRFEFMLSEGQTREHMEDPATVRSYLARHVDVDKFDVLRKLVYTFNALVANRWRERRVLLAGDAAHMTPQFIGQGMNAGVRDAYNLGWKLHAVLSGQAGDALLDSYEAERRPHATAMIREGVRVKGFVSIAHPVLASLRNIATRLVKRLPFIGSYVVRGQFIPKPVYANGAYLGLPRKRRCSAEGTLMPQPPVRGCDGRRHRFDDLLGTGFALIGAGVDPRALLTCAERDQLKAIGARFAVMYKFGERPYGDTDSEWSPDLIELDDVTGAWFDWFDRCNGRPGNIVIVRPDKFVFGLVHGKRLSAAVGNLITTLRRGLAAETPTSIVSRRSEPHPNLKEAA